MSITKFNGSKVNTITDFIEVGSDAPDFCLVKGDLSDMKLSELKGKKVVLNIFPSIDTGVCAASVRQFNKIAAKTPNTVVLAISKDLPFAASRFCSAEGIDNVLPLSDFRQSEFDRDYGVLMIDGPLKGLLARAVVIVDEAGKVIYAQLVDEITHEPDYDKALKALSDAQ